MDKRALIQEEAVDTFIKSGTGILKIAQRVGKIKIGLECIKRLQPKNVLIGYPDNKIKDSWEKDIDKWGHPTGQNNIHFSNYSSFKNICEDEWDMIILDEIHATSENQRNIICDMIHASNIYPRYMLGLSGTISDETAGELKSVLGLDILMSYSIAEAIADDIIAPYEIKVHLVDLDNVPRELDKKGNMISEKTKYNRYTYVFEKLKEEGKPYKFIVLHRNRVLQSSYSKRLKTLQLLKTLKGKKILVFTGLKKISESLGIPFYHSTSADTTVFDAFKSGRIQEIAVVNIGRAGVTFDYLDVIIINSFTGNEETTEQIVARALNKDKQNKLAEIHIVCSKEPAELKKLRATLANLENIEYV